MNHFFLRALACLTFAGTLGGCMVTGDPTATLASERELELAEASIGRLLDDWHAAASEADFERYFGHMAADSVFMGTDATERWTLDEFKAYAKPVFDDGRGWTYRPIERYIVVHESGSVAWFDERLMNEKLGECRGTGVVVLGSDGRWRIAHDSLTVPIPNEIVLDVAERVRQLNAGG